VVAQQPSPLGRLAAISNKVELIGDTDVCTNVQYPYIVKITQDYGYDNGLTTGRGTPLIEYVSHGPIGAPFTLVAPRGTVTGRTTFLGTRSLLVSFPTPGPYTVTATTPAPTAPGPGIDTFVDQGSMHVKARSCDFELTMLSVWYHLPDGFKPWVGGIVDAVRLHPDSSGYYRATAPLRTFAIAAPEGGCVPTFDVEDVKARITGIISPGGSLYLTIDYPPGTSHTSVVCGSLAGASRPDTFTLDSIKADFDVSRLSETADFPVAPHVLHASSTVDGVTYVIVTPLQ
jgi:hypothetical protein